jgi:poly(hydroxyalkanoate) depolymerase family esterase
MDKRLMKVCMNETQQHLMREATRLTRAGKLSEATEAIQRALRGDAPPPATPGPPPPPPPADPDHAAKPGAVTLDATPTVPGGNIFEVNPRDYAAAKADLAAAETVHRKEPQSPAPNPAEDEHADADEGVGEFTSGIYKQASKTLRYKLYVPPRALGRSLPLVVMLHGCTQDPDDFAAGTGMNTAAREQGFFVLYPAQAQTANSQRCWNWFQPQDQKRGSGEPALIAGITLETIKKYGIDPRRVYIAGLSAGGAMATIVAEAYPEIFAAVGVHSGLPRGSASNVMEAFSVMQSGDNTRKAKMAGVNMQVSVPTIVFHGDLDQTVHPRNGEQVIAAVLREGGNANVERGVSTKGRRYTRSSHVDGNGKQLAEHWLVHGAGHAWSGGDAAGSYTDASGPDATREMLRFFFAQ